MIGLEEIQRRTRVGIMTWHYYANVGSNLQAYAMQKVLRGMGFDTQFVNYRKKELDGDRFPKGMIKGLCDSLSFFPSFDTWRFQQDEFSQTRKTYKAEVARSLCEEFDAVVCGSDQIWAPNVFDPVYFLEGVTDRVRKVSYAASIGLPDIPESLRSRYRKCLSHFDAIGVREDQGRDLIERELGLKATTVLDPTFLLSREEWLRLAIKSHTDAGKYIFCYFLGSPMRYSAAVAKAAEMTGLPVVAYLPESSAEGIPDALVLRRMAVPAFIDWLQGASLVITDSFHGVALSVNLEREFAAYCRFDEDDAINQNSRVVNILRKLGLEDHLQPLGVFDPVPIDWNAVGNRLNSERASSRAFLESALSDIGGDSSCRA